MRFDALRLFLGLDRQFRRNALRIAFAARPHRTEQTGRAFRRTHRRAHLHHRVGKRAGTIRRNERLRLLLDALAGGRRPHFIPNSKIPADHALDIAIHRGNRDAEGDCRNRSARIIPDTGKRAQFFHIGGQLPAIFVNDDLRRLLQRPRAAVIPQPLPELEQFLLRRVRQRAYMGIMRKETFIIRNDRFGTRLLKHDLRYPDRISVLRPAPGQVAMPRIIPVKD